MRYAKLTHPTRGAIALKQQGQDVNSDRLVLSWREELAQLRDRVASVVT